MDRNDVHNENCVCMAKITKQESNEEPRRESAHGKKVAVCGVNGNNNSTHQMSQLSVLAANKWIAITSKVDKRAD